MDIVAAASANADGWIADADQSCRDEPRLIPFRTACAVSAIGSNVDAAKLQHFRQLNPPRIVSTYAVRAADSGAGPAFDATYVHGEWGPKRLAIDTALGGVGTAVYGTVDLPGSAGDYRYGYFRLSYGAGDSKPLVFPHNTALTYAPNGVIEEELLEQDAANWSERAEVCVKAVGDSAVEVPAAQWPLLLASERAGNEPDLIEVVVVNGERKLADVTEIRVEENRLKSLLKAALSALLRPGESDLAVYIAAELAAEAEAGILKLVPVKVGP